MQKKKDFGLITAFILPLSIPWFLNLSCLPSPQTPPSPFLLLAEQALYYSDKFVRVGTGECVYVLGKECENACGLAMSITYKQGEGISPKLTLKAPFIL